MFHILPNMPGAGLWSCMLCRRAICAGSLERFCSCSDAKSPAPADALLPRTLVSCGGCEGRGRADVPVAEPCRRKSSR